MTVKAAVCPAVGLDCAGLRVTRLARSLRFLTGSLGTREVGRGSIKEGGNPTQEGRPDLPRARRSLPVLLGSRCATRFVPGEGLNPLGWRVTIVAAAGRQLRADAVKRIEQVRHRGKAVVGSSEGPAGLRVEPVHFPTI